MKSELSALDRKIQLELDPLNVNIETKKGEKIKPIDISMDKGYNIVNAFSTESKHNKNRPSF